MGIFTLKKKEAVDEQLERLMHMNGERIVAGGKEVERQLALIQMTTKDLAILQHVRPHIEQHVGRIAEAFYGALQKEEHLFSLILEHSTIDRLKQTLTIHVKEMFNGRIDESFIEKRRRIAKAHVRIGLEPKWYIASFQHLFEAMLQIVQEEYERPAYVFAVMKSITKMLNLEQQIVLEAYEQEIEGLRLQMDKLKQQVKEQLKVSIHHLSHVSEEVSASVSSLNDQASDISSFAQEASAIAKDGSQKSEEGRKHLQTQVEKMQAMSGKMKTIQENMKHLQQAMMEIEHIATLVTSIADQTNMLSLNASIEAARAGEHGKGFAVVAEEVRKLASQTKQSVGDVTNVVAEIHRQIEAMAQSLREVDSAVTDGTDYIQRVHSFFDEFSHALEQICQYSVRIDEEMKVCVDAVGEIQEAIAHVSSSTDELEAIASDL